MNSKIHCQPNSVVAATQLRLSMSLSRFLPLILSFSICVSPSPFLSLCVLCVVVVLVARLCCAVAHLSPFCYGNWPSSVASFVGTEHTNICRYIYIFIHTYICNCICIAILQTQLELHSICYVFFVSLCSYLVFFWATVQSFCWFHIENKCNSSFG